MRIRILRSFCYFAVSLSSSRMRAGASEGRLSFPDRPAMVALKHEHRAGNMILAGALNSSGLDVEAVLRPECRVSSG